MSEQQRQRPTPTRPDGSADRNGHDLGSDAALDGGIPAQIPDSQPSGEAKEAIERATAVVGDDEGDAS